MKLTRLLFFTALSLAPLMLLAQVPTTILRGTITDADNNRPLPGATILLLDTEPATGTTSGPLGHYRLDNVPVGRYRMQISFVGYETITIAEVLVESGKDAVEDVQLREQSAALQEVVVKAQGRGNASLHPLSVHTITVEEQFRFPATYYDPARVAMSFPGVAGDHDGTNIISIRGNSPNALQWRLEGVEIVNPNHTANAGTFGDRPTQAAGGVNILSAQLLNTSSFLTGAFPAAYGNALGGILDMGLRRGNDEEREVTLQAGFIGIEAAVEGPFKRRTKHEEQTSSEGNPEDTPQPTDRSAASYLANYRYSFTGLLAELGVDFGGEATAFQDFSIHVSLPSKKAGDFSFFGMRGKSSTVFDSPKDSTDITEEKERFNIDFNSIMDALGVAHVLPVGKNGVWRTAAAMSALEHQRTADLVENQPQPRRLERDFMETGKIAFSSNYSQKINPRLRLAGGLHASWEDMNFNALYSSESELLQIGDEVKGWMLQPWMDGHWQILPKLNLTVGLHLSHFTAAGETSIEPRAALVFLPGKNQRISLAYGLHSQMQVPQVYVFERALDFTRSHHLLAGYRQVLGNSLVFNGEVYYQYLFDVPVAMEPGRTFSVLNLTDFNLAYLAGQDGVITPLANAGKGRNYGVELSLQKFISGRYYFIWSNSLYRSEYAGPDGAWRSTRFDGRYIFNLTGGREFYKQKTTNSGKEKTVVKGVNVRAAWYGGFRDTPIDLAASEVLGRTVFDEGAAFTLKQEDYYRIDLRLYIKWNKTGRNSTLSLDLQNLTGRQNEQYSYYDTVQDKVVVKKQLGLVPILSWRMEF